MMRKYIFIGMMMVMAWGCDDFLTVKPKSDIKDVELFSTAEGCEDAIYGAYAKLGADGLYGREMRYYLPEVLAQSYYSDLDAGSEGSALSEIRNYKHSMTYAREEYGVAWRSMYEAIGFVNNIISNLEAKGKGSFKYYDCYLGEALGMRAFLHFDLVRLFAPHYTSQPDERGIPYVKQWVAQVTPFSTVKEVYRNVLTDLKESERLLVATGKIEREEKDEFMKQRNLHFNLEAARATLARVYWMIGELDSARIYAEEVIATNKYEMAAMTEVQNLLACVVSGKETIWGIEQRDPLSALEDDFYTLHYLFPRKDIMNYYRTEGDFNDARQYWFRDKKINPLGQLCFLKFFDESHYYSPIESPYNGTPGFSLIRIPEMYLIAAEALVEKDPAKATTYFDQVGVARGRGSLKERGKSVTLSDINEERFREFFGEGYEWYNMKRQNRDLYIPGTSETVSGTDALYTITIPDDEFDYRYMD